MSEVSPIDRCRILEMDLINREVEECLEDVVKKIDESENNLGKRKVLINNEFLIVSAISLMCFWCMKLSFIDMLLIISLILLIIAVLMKDKKEESDEEQNE